MSVISSVFITERNLSVLVSGCHLLALASSTSATRSKLKGAARVIQLLRPDREQQDLIPARYWLDSNDSVSGLVDYLASLFAYPVSADWYHHIPARLWSLNHSSCLAISSAMFSKI